MSQASHFDGAKPLHRLREIREMVGLTIEQVAEAMGTSVATATREEDPSSDLPVSTLLRWQRALGIPFHRLLVEPDSTISLPGLTDERLSLLEGIAQELRNAAKDNATRAFADGLQRQLEELRPSRKRDDDPSRPAGPRSHHYSR